MSYAIIRNANYKKDNLAGLYKHNERKNTNYSNKDINKSKSIENYSIKQCNTTYSNAIKILQKENDLQGRIIKTTNVACEFIITSDREFFEQIGVQETKRYFQIAYNFVANYKSLSKKYILSAKVHLDESTPHLHVVFIPVVHKIDKKSGKQIDKIACSEYWKGKDSYRQLQDNFYKYISDNGFNLERGKQKNTKHIDTETLKQITNYDNIKYELDHKDMHLVDTKNKNLILKQNTELISYTHKLKLQLSKSYTTIKRIEELQKENYKLKNYIEKTLEVVKHLFNFPLDTFKSLVDNFVKHFER